jgi:hypothetical protein
MQPTYKCRCGTTLIVYEGERRIKCGVCGETHKLPAIYWESGQSRQPEVPLEQPERPPRQPENSSLSSGELIGVGIILTVLCVLILMKLFS